MVAPADEDEGEFMNEMLEYWVARRVKSEVVVTDLASVLMLTIPNPPKAGKYETTNEDQENDGCG